MTDLSFHEIFYGRVDPNGNIRVDPKCRPGGAGLQLDPYDRSH